MNKTTNHLGIDTGRSINGVERLTAAGNTLRNGTGTEAIRVFKRIDEIVDAAGIKQVDIAANRLWLTFLEREDVRDGTLDDARYNDVWDETVTVAEVASKDVEHIETDRCVSELTEIDGKWTERHSPRCGRCQAV